MKDKIEARVKEITTAYMIGLGYTVPPYNGKHSKEYFKQLLSLFKEEFEKLVGEDEENEYFRAYQKELRAKIKKL